MAKSYIQDLICLTQMIDVAADNNIESEELVTDFDCLACKLRNAIYMLKYIKLESERASNHNEIGQDRRFELWLDGRGLTNNHNSTAGTFISHSIELRKGQNNAFKACQTSEGAKLSKRIDSWSTTEQTQQTVITTLFSSRWFLQFVSLILDEPYPIKKLVPVIVTLIASQSCEHSQATELMIDLIPQIHCDQASSYRLDDCIELVEPGSIWLSYHKQLRSGSLFVDYKHEITSGQDDSYSRSNSSDSLEMDTRTKSSAAEYKISENLDLQKKQLRTIIDNELLIGLSCVICGAEPDRTQPLGALDKPHALCTQCAAIGSRRTELRCSISARPIELLDLTHFLRPISSDCDLEGLVLLSAGEWCRYDTRTSSQDDTRASCANQYERVDISEKFQRLTVIRATNEIEKPNVPIESAEAMEISQIIELSAHKDNRLDRGEQSTCGSLRVLRYVNQNPSIRTRKLPICESDLLLIEQDAGDARGVLSRLKVAARHYPDATAGGSIWVCCERSPVSGLMIGCDRVFLSSELIRLGGLLEANQSRRVQICPMCSNTLSELEPMSELDMNSLRVS